MRDGYAKDVFSPARYRSLEPTEVTGFYLILFSFSDEKKLCVSVHSVREKIIDVSEGQYELG